jgi:hypothetical protein
VYRIELTILRTDRKIYAWELMDKPTDWQLPASAPELLGRSFLIRIKRYEAGIRRPPATRVVEWMAEVFE